MSKLCDAPRFVDGFGGPKAAPPEAGDTWTWIALDADHKLVISWAIGRRDLETAYGFMMDVAERLPHRIQMTRLTGVGTPRSLQGRAVSAICRLIGRLIDRWGRLTRAWGSKWTPATLAGSIAHRQAA